MSSISLRAITVAALVSLAATAGTIAACYQPGFAACAVRCETGGGCPDGTTCSGDGFCHGSGDPETCTTPPLPDAHLLDDGGTPPDAPPPDATIGPGSPPVARLISTAFFSNTNASAGMSHDGFSIPTNGVHDGDLMLFIASIDNGSNTVFPNPIATGFHQLTQQFYGHDGQTFVVQYKIADHEPVNYTGTYGSGLGSGASVLNLVAFTNFDPAQPINAIHVFHEPQTTADMTPVFGNSPGVTTTVDHCLLVYASGADWGGSPGENTFETPTGFTKLAEFGDHGDNSWDWTSQQIDTKVQDAAGATGPVTGSLTGTFNGTAWTVLLAIAPPP
jgi:hypothetical protein